MLWTCRHGKKHRKNEEIKGNSEQYFAIRLSFPHTQHPPIIITIMNSTKLQTTYV